MALGAATFDSTHSGGGNGSAPVRFDNFSFAGDGAYPSGGTAAFETYVRAKLGRKVTVITIIPGDCGGYTPVYDVANDKLKIYEQTNVATSPNIETATADLSGTTFNMVVVSV